MNGIDFPDFDLERDLQVAEVEGIEIFQGASSVPAQYGGAASMCGVVLFWLRAG